MGLSDWKDKKCHLRMAKATPAPPVGPAIGAFGLNIAFFVKAEEIKLERFTTNALFVTSRSTMPSLPTRWAKKFIKISV